MFAVILLATGSSRHMAATSTSCIAAVADGLVGHGVVVARAEDGPSQKLADAIGADMVVQTGNRAADIISACHKARGEWLFILEAGDLPQEGWIGALERHALATDRPALMSGFGVHGLKERLAVRTGFASPGPGWAIRRADLLGAATGLKLRPLILPLRRTRIRD